MQGEMEGNHEISSKGRVEYCFLARDENRFNEWQNVWDHMKWMSPRSSFLWDRFGGLREEKRVLGEEERKNEIGKQRKLRSQFENWPSLLLFINRGIHNILFTLFIYFYYFVKKETLFYSPSTE